MKAPVERALLRLARRRDLARVVAGVVVVGLVLAHAALALAARPGGGSSYSGGSSRSSGGSSSSGSSSGGGDSGELIGWLIVLCFEHPALGIPIAIIVLVWFVIQHRSSRAGNEWQTAEVADSSPTSFAPPPAPGIPPRTQLEALRATDPGFSVIVFEDFLYFLYAEMHRARGAGQTEALAAWLGDDAREALRNDGRIEAVTGIIIGGISYEDVDVEPDGSARITVVVESNLVERTRPSGEARFYLKEELTLVRAAGARSRTPDKARVLTCPNCGAPLASMRGRQCGHCRTLIETGQKDWGIEDVTELEREPRGPLLTSTVEEQGTHLPTVLDPRARDVFTLMQRKDPTLTWQRFEARVALVFQEFHAGWVGRDPARVRPFVSDNLFQSQLYWIDLYVQGKCVNRTDGARILRIELATATTDAYYDAVTVRLFATGLDYTVSEDGKLLSGDPHKPRQYSEYWTFMRGAQKRATPPDRTDRQCPNCGAPLTINMAGSCQYCKVKVTSGEFDWVLSRIEQDEAYAG
jgi:hypothetical protein